jgi:GTPase SAR1 family protein
MSLQAVADRRVFASVTDGAKLTERYVPSERLGAVTGPDRPEAMIWQACTSSTGAARVHVEGPAGSGKTSLILSIIGQLARAAPGKPVQPLVVNTGASSALLKNQTAFLDFMLDLIAIEGRFATLDTRELAEATADQITLTPAAVTHQIGVDAKVLSYSATLTAAIKTITAGRNAAKTEATFGRIIKALAADFRPLVVIDDTDHFAGGGANGTIDEQALTQLYTHGIHTLAEYPQLDLIVAIQPRFRDLPAVADVESRFGFTCVEVAQLPAETEDLALRRVLERRLQLADIDSAVADLIDDLALAALQSAYFTRGCDLRWVLDQAHEAATRAVSAKADMITLAHVQPLLLG